MRKIRDCSVAVVGGAGFLGSHLVNLLVEGRGCRVTVVDNLVAGRREYVHKDARLFHHDITLSEEHLKNIFEAQSVKYVWNLAAYPYIPTSFSRPKLVCDVNFMGAINVINAAQEAGCEGILQVSSAEIYGEGCHISRDDPAHSDKVEVYKLTEDSTVRPHSSYGASKAAVDYYCQSAWRERKTPVIAVRQFNCVGERETHPYVIPEIIGQLSKFPLRKLKWVVDHEETELIVPTVQLGNNSFRDFLYAGEAVEMMVELLEKGRWGEVYNSGSEDGVKIYDLAKLIGEEMGFKEVRVVQDEARVRPWEIWHLQSDNTKLYKTIEHRPKVDLREAVRRTVADYQQRGCRWCWE